MPSVNITDSRKRDAVVKAESTAITEDVRYLDKSGSDAVTRKILKATVDHDYNTLLENCENDNERLVKALVESDPEVDIEKCGVYLWGVSKVYVNSDDGVVYRIEQTEIVRDPDGNVKEKRPRHRAEANVDMEIPLTWTGKKIPKPEAVRLFLFSSKLQIVHVNGLTYDFLFGMAKELSESNSLMMIGAGKNGRDPLIFRSGSIPYRGFLEGRVEGEKYVLLLHLSNMELKLPNSQSDSAVVAETVVSEKPEVKTGDKKDDETVASQASNEKLIENTGNKAKGESKKSRAAEEVSENTADQEVVSESADKVEEKSLQEASVVLSKATEEVAEDTSASPPQNELPNSEDLGVWLKSIRMGKYLKLFIENEIDIDVLPELTDEDLKELEIPLGSRRRLLKALAQTENLRAEIAMVVSTMTGSTAADKEKKSNSKNTKKSESKSKKKSKPKSSERK